MIDKYFVVDFDRCLGSVDASFGLLKDVVDELNLPVNSLTLQRASDEADSRGESFSVFQFIKQNYPNVINFDAIESSYIERASSNPRALHEPGAQQLINALKNSKSAFCIMSYGEVHWQMVKIRAAGFGDIPVDIIDTKYKAEQIAKWYDQQADFFIIPETYFSDNLSRNAKEVVLIDDKASAFSNMPIGVRGYWVRNPSKLYAFQEGELPDSVQTVASVDEIIALEHLNVA
jgi:hypothetical protein